MHYSKSLFSGILLIFSIVTFSQSEADYKASTIPIELKTKANAVVRYDKQTVEINDFDDFLLVLKREYFLGFDLNEVYLDCLEVLEKTVFFLDIFLEKLLLEC